MPELETVDFDAVEILSEGGPYHGAGSPKEGDYFDADFLKRLAASNAALAEVHPPLKIGHNTAQKLLVDSGLSADEMPAAGWLANIRVGERDGIAKLLGDFKAVPKKLAALVESGAFRSRSVEIGRVTAQAGERAGEKLTAITGVVLLGAKAPAVRTLDDIVALYADEGADDDFGDLAEVIITDARPGSTGVASLEADGKKWVVPFERWGDTLEMADRADWREEEEEMPTIEKPADTGGMSMQTLSAEQLRTLASTFGIGDEIEGDELRVAVADKMKDLVVEETPEVEEEEPVPVPAPGTVTLSEAEVAELKANSALAKALAEERRLERREATVVVGGIEKGKLAPAESETWLALYDANPEATAKAIAEMPVNDELLRAFGSDGDGDGDTSDDQQEEDEYRAFAASLGLSGEEG